MAMMIICMEMSCDNDNYLSIAVENMSGDTIYAFIGIASFAHLDERPNRHGLCSCIEEYKVLYQNEKTTAFKTYEDYGNAYKVYVVRKNNGNNFLERPELPMAFDYSHVFNYDDLKDINFCITVRDTDLQGRRLRTIPAKGVYIQDGRKRVVR